MIEEISMSEAEKNFSELVDRATDSGTRFILKKGNKAVAAIINLEDFNLIEKKSNLKEKGTLIKARGAWSEFDSLDQFIHDIYHAPMTQKDREVELE